MAWGARQDDDGTWRLCERKGRTIRFVCQELWPDIQIVWKTRSGAQKCAEELNETHWPAYDKAQRAAKDAPPLDWQIVLVILKHQGITPEQYDRM